MNYRNAVFLLIFLILYIVWKDRTSPAFVIPIKTPSPTYLGMMTYNIQYLPWKTKALDNLRSISRGYPIIFLQECFNRHTTLDLSSIFPEYYISRGKLQGLALVNSGLVTLSQYPILSHELVIFKNYRPYTSDSLSEKGFLVTIIDINGQETCCINTHLQSSDHTEYDPIVFDQLKEILEYLTNVKIPYIIAGDFNVDVKEMKQYNVIAPTEPTIYIDLKSGDSTTRPLANYNGYIFDYFIVHPLIKTSVPITYTTEYSDHNPVFLLLDKHIYK